MNLKKSLIFLFGFFIAVNICEAHRPHDVIFSLAVSPQFHEDMELSCSVNHHTLHVLRSTNRGVTWRPFQNGLPDINVTALAYSPSYEIDHTIFAGTNEGYVYQSTNGSVWQSDSNGLPRAKITCLSISPSFLSDQTIFVGLLNAGVYKTTDGGMNWAASNSGLSNLGINCLSISAGFLQDKNIFVGTTGGIFKSTDGGSTWFPKNDGLEQFYITSLCMSPDYTNDHEVFAGTYGGGVYKSFDKGDFWFKINDGISDLFVTTIAVSPGYASDKTLVAASKDFGVFKSEDGGVSWGLFDQGLEWRTSQYYIHFLNLAFSPNYENDQTIFVGMFEGLFKSNDGGNSWFEMNVYQPNLSRSVAVSPDYVNDKCVIYSTYGGGVYRSSDGGNTWNTGNMGLSSPFIFSIAYAPDYTVFAVGTGFEGDPSRFYRSINDGRTWESTVIAPEDNYLPTVNGFALSPNFQIDETVFLGNRSNGSYALYKSTNGGISFYPVNIEPDNVFSIAVSPSFAVDNTLYVGTEKGVYKSYDQGESWVFAGLTQMTIYSLSISNDGNLFAGTIGNGVFRSLDGGEIWSPVNSGLTDLTIESICISPNYENDHTVFVATLGAGVFKSTDEGDSWQSSGLIGNFVQGLSISPFYEIDQTVFAGTWDGVYKSSDGGSNYEFASTFIRYEETFDPLIYEGTWQTFDHLQLSTSSLVYSSHVGNSVTLPFWGTAVRLIGAKGFNHGKADIYIDGIFQETVDLYLPRNPVIQTIYKKFQLPLGLHEISAVVAPSGNGNILSIDAFDVGLNDPTN